MVLKACPFETGGLILDDGRVVQLPNKADNPSNSFQIDRSDVVEALLNENETRTLTIWHSHPGGNIGPSRTDLRLKTAIPYHLVLALVDGDLVPTWY